MTETHNHKALCPHCGKNLAQAGISSTVVESGEGNMVLFSCGACSNVFAAMPGPLVPARED
jgi:hypothetical protein